MINLCVHGVPPASVYKGANGEGASGQEEGAGGVLLLPGVGLPPPILVGLGFPEGERERGGRRPPPSLSLFSHLANPIPTRIGGEVLLPQS